MSVLDGAATRGRPASVAAALRCWIRLVLPHGKRLWGDVTSDLVWAVAKAPNLKITRACLKSLIYRHIPEIHIADLRQTKGDMSGARKRPPNPSVRRPILA